MEATKHHIKKFPMDGGCWRLDWFGKIRWNEDVKSEPEIQVFLTRLKDSPNPTLAPLHPYSLDSSRRYETFIGVGLLPLVYIGSVWEKGYRIDERRRVETSTFLIDTLHAAAIPFSSNATGAPNRRLIPPTQYPLGSAAWSVVQHSPIIAIPNNNDPEGILIPAIELIRFYYIFSSSSARALFLNKYNILIDECRFDSAASKPDVEMKLAWYARIKDAWVLARYAVSGYMQEQVNRIYTWVQLNHKNGWEKSGDMIQSTLFPFDGSTRLKAEGVSLIGDDGKKRFLVTRLLKCSFPMPYSEVAVVREKRPEGDDSNGDSIAHTISAWPSDYSNDEEELPYSNEQEPDKKVQRLILEIDEERFDDLASKKIRRILELVQPRKRKLIFLESTGKKEGLGTGEGTWSDSDLSPAELKSNVAAKESPSAVSLNIIVHTLRYLRAQGVKVEGVALSEKVSTVLGETFSYFPMTSSWGIMNIVPPRPRMLLAARIKYGGQISYLFEIERDSTKKSDVHSVMLMHSVGYEEIPDQDLKSVMTDCVKDRGWKRDSASRIYRRKLIPHPAMPPQTETIPVKDLGEKLGKRIYAALKRFSETRYRNV